MKSSKELREQIAELDDRVEAICSVAKEQKRDLSDAEAKEVDEIIGRGKAGEQGHVQGKIPALKSELERVEAIEARQLEIAASRRGATTIQPTQASEPEVNGRANGTANDRVSKVLIPATARFRHTSLKAYKGPKADEKAYMAGRFFLATIFRDDESAKWCQEHGIDMRFRAVLKESANELGGFLVFEEMEQTIIDLREQYGVFRREARVVPMASDTKSFPRRTGGLTAYFVGEGEGVTASDKSWDQVRLVAKKIAALTRYSSELSEDAVISIGDDLTGEMAYAFASKEDGCGFLGDGTTTYGGIVGLINAIQDGSTVTAATGNTSFGTLDLTDFEAMVGKLPQYAEANAKWYISKAGYAASMLRLVDAAGGNTIQTLEGGAVMREFLGYPVVISQKMNSTLTAQTSTDGLAYFGDLRMAAVLGNRRGMSILPSEHRYMELDQIAIRGTERFDINVHERGTASAAGAIVMLSTPAS